MGAPRRAGAVPGAIFLSVCFSPLRSLCRRDQELALDFPGWGGSRLVGLSRPPPWAVSEAVGSWSVPPRRGGKEKSPKTPGPAAVLGGFCPSPRCGRSGLFHTGCSRHAAGNYAVSLASWIKDVTSPAAMGRNLRWLYRGMGEASPHPSSRRRLLANSLPGCEGVSRARRAALRPAPGWEIPRPQRTWGCRELKLDNCKRALAGLREGSSNPHIAHPVPALWWCCCSAAGALHWKKLGRKAPKMSLPHGGGVQELPVPACVAAGGSLALARAGGLLRSAGGCLYDELISVKCKR